MTASVWNPAGTSANVANANNTYQAQRFVVATVGQTIFFLTDFSYIPGTGSLLIEVNGVDQYIGNDFLETSGVQITFTSGLVLDDVVVIRGLVGITGAAGAAAIAAMAAIQLLNVPNLPLALNAGGTGTSAASSIAAFNVLAPSTSKGDLIVHNGTNNVRVPIGANRSKLISDATQASGVNWVTDGIKNVAISTNTSVSSTDIEKLFRCSGSLTLNFDTPANLGADWYCIVKNTNTITGEITIPSSDGRTNWKMYANEERLFTSDGTTIYSYVLNNFYTEITTLVSFIFPPGYPEIAGKATSGGASGQRTNNVTATSSGGSGGGTFPFSFTYAQFGNSQLISPGIGGAAVTTVQSGIAGGDTTIGSLLTITGATNASGGAISGFIGSSIIFDAGFASTSANAAGGKTIWGGSASSTNATVNSGNSIEGAPAGGSVDGSGNIRTPGSSLLGVGGIAAINTNGLIGTGWGAGGGATQTGTQSGPGSPGGVKIRGVI